MTLVFAGLLACSYDTQTTTSAVLGTHSAAVQSLAYIPEKGARWRAEHVVMGFRLGMGPTGLPGQDWAAAEKSRRAAACTCCSTPSRTLDPIPSSGHTFLPCPPAPARPLCPLPCCTRCSASRGHPLRPSPCWCAGVLLTGSWDQSLKAWDPRAPPGQNCTAVVSLPGKVYGMSAGSERLVVATSGRHILIYDIRKCVVAPIIMWMRTRVGSRGQQVLQAMRCPQCVPCSWLDLT